jgi:hypothetical protein
LNASSVHAQSPSAPGQPQGLFGGVRPDTAAKTKLDFTASVSEGYDSNVPTSFLQSIDPSSLQSGGFSTVFSTSAAYAWRTTRTEVAFNGNSSFKHYADIGETRGVGNSLGVGVSARLPGHMTLMANQAAAYTPAYLSGIFPTGVSVEPGTPGGTAPDYTVSDFRSSTYSSTIALKRDFSQRSSFVASGDFQYTNRVLESPLWQDVIGYWFRGEYSRNVGRNTAITMRYRYIAMERSATPMTCERRTLTGFRRELLQGAVGDAACDVSFQRRRFWGRCASIRLKSGSSTFVNISATELPTSSMSSNDGGERMQTTAVASST